MRTGGLIVSVLTSTSRASRFAICARDMPMTAPSSATPATTTPPAALAKAAIASAQSLRVGRFGRSPANLTCLNSQLLSSPERNRLSISSTR